MVVAKAAESNLRWVHQYPAMPDTSASNNCESMTIARIKAYMLVSPNGTPSSQLSAGLDGFPLPLSSRAFGEFPQALYEAYKSTWMNPVSVARRIGP